MPDRIYGLAELAEAIGVSQNTLKARRLRGKLPAPTEHLRCGDVWQGPEIEAWIAQHSSGRAAQNSAVSWDS